MMAGWGGKGPGFFLMKQILKNKERAFWLLQVTGWLAYGVMRLAQGYANGRSIDYIKPTIVAMVTGFILSLVMRGVYRSFKDKPIGVIMSVSVLVPVFLAIIFSTIETIGHVQFYNPFWAPRGLEYVGNMAIDIYVLLAWTALYFGINYYLQLQLESRKALESASMANQAQLTMLRYQLNPHFLFNTLNAISTLVLSRESKTANDMLRKLSSFLRYTLVNQPAQQVTLEKEVETLKLYLDIEKVRFQERLRISWEINKNAEKALMPSLLLQPLVENAIKYAIAPSEDGGTISVFGAIEGNRLVLRVSDNGPGLGHENPLPASESSSVGIANIRDRLKQLYGIDHSFQLQNLQPNGLCVTIDMPVETGITHVVGTE
jgi:two-component system, LytTR family, sensor kinase